MNSNFEKDLSAQLWKMANSLRGPIPTGKYKDVVLGIVFLKYISDSFLNRYNELVAEGEGFEEDEDEYKLDNVFFVPPKARWDYIKMNASLPTIGEIIDNALIEIEKNNPTLKGVLPKIYGNRDIDSVALGELINGFSVDFNVDGYNAKDILGRVYEYFLHKFGTTEKGEFYTPNSIVKLIVEMIEPYEGRIYDPACGSGGMFIQSANFIEAHKGRKDLISVYGQEYTADTWRLCKMNIAIHGLNGNLGDKPEDTFRNDLHKNTKMDFIMANPPFNVSTYDLNPEDVRYKRFGLPPSGNANYAWLSHMVNKLSAKGKAGIVLANGSMSTSNANELAIRKGFLEAGIVDSIVAMPSNLFFGVTIPVCIWFFDNDKKNKDVLFIDARNMGEMETRALRVLSNNDIDLISKTYHNYKKDENYEDVKGFCKVASLDEIKNADYTLTPGRYVGIEELVDDDEDFDIKMNRLTSELGELFKNSSELESEIKKQLGAIGYEI
jgi:type I restriction enzyme M protein